MCEKTYYYKSWTLNLLFERNIKLAHGMIIFINTNMVYPVFPVSAVGTICGQNVWITYDYNVFLIIN